MNINRSHAVDNFKQYGYLRYHGAQKFPIEIYKDTILLYELVESIAHIKRHNTRKALEDTVQLWYNAYHSKNYDDHQYG
jgi:quinol monooxygenase YgiN